MTLEFLGQVEMGSAYALTTKEATVTPKFLSKEGHGTTTTPKYSSREESKVATSIKKEGRPCRTKDPGH